MNSESSRCRPCGAPKTDRPKCEYCGTINRNAPVQFAICGMLTSNPNMAGDLSGISLAQRYAVSQHLQQSGSIHERGHPNSPLLNWLESAFF